MKILHTADWHIGQLFHEYDRTAEHRHFLEWLVNTLLEEKIDVLLVSGDVFDISNPAAASVKMFYTFLNKATRTCPNLQIIITAGNHDSASRLEAPKPLLESSKVHIIGLVEKHDDGSVDYEKLCIPIYDGTGNIKIWCLAIPFLRMGDYPAVSDCDNPYAEGVAKLYEQAYEYVREKKQPGQSVIAMGHLHTQAAEKTDLDNTERLIMGGVECIPAAAFHPDITYVALGHIHKAQKIAGKEHIRYAGSILPLSFSELNYKHQVIIVDMENGAPEIKTLEIPELIPLLRVPVTPLPLAEVLNQLSLLPDAESPLFNAPYLEVRVLLDGPEPALRHKVESAVTGKNVRLATLKPSYRQVKDNEDLRITQDILTDLQPQDVFEKIYRSRYNTEVPTDLIRLFRQVSEDITQSGQP